MPQVSQIVASGTPKTERLMQLTVEEYESIRLIDYVGCTQSEAAQYMCVARTTIQAIYFNARKKMAQLIVEGGTLSIEGGEYTICEGGCNNPECANCDKCK